jgi:hypothetical protein
MLYIILNFLLQFSRSLFVINSLDYVNLTINIQNFGDFMELVQITLNELFK